MEAKIHSFDGEQHEAVRDAAAPTLMALINASETPVRNAPSVSSTGVLLPLSKTREIDEAAFPEPVPGLYAEIREKGWRHTATSPTQTAHVLRHPQDTVVHVNVMTSTVTTPSEGDEHHELLQVTEGTSSEEWRCFADFLGDKCVALFVSTATPEEALAGTERLEPSPEQVLEAVLKDVQKVLERFNKAVPIVCERGSR